MPQLPRDVIKTRAARLRAAGEAALSRHLDRHVGTEAMMLVEQASTGRLPDFSPVRLVTPFSGDTGRPIPIRITGHDGKTLSGTHA
jgi:threonylcarbamoyladenosine tRNA methylthiotransferase MtaB